MTDTARVELAYPYTDANGKTHKADAVIELPTAEASNLVHFGRARVAKKKAAEAANTSKEK